MVVHTCNPSYSGGRDRSTANSRLAQAKLVLRPYLKVKILGMWLSGRVKAEGPEFNPHEHKKKKKKKKPKVYSV
jgi:hypothetical protein